MQTVQPIRDKKIIEMFKKELIKKDYKYYVMFMIGINTGLRISDILKLKVEDVRDQEHIKIIEKKTQKKKRFYINSTLKELFETYTEGMEDDEYLIQSRKGTNKPISRIQAYRALNDVAAKLSLKEIGTHTLRKTFGYWHYKQFKDVALLQKLFNHSAPSITLDYIGINADIMDESIKDFSL